MTIAAYQKKLLVSNDNFTTSHEIPCDGPSLSLNGEMIDTTVVNGDGFRQKLAALKNWSISAEAFFEKADWFDTLMSAWRNNSKVQLRYHPSDSNTLYLGGEAYVENLNFAGDVASAEKTSIALSGTGPLTLTAP